MGFEPLLFKIFRDEPCNYSDAITKIVKKNIPFEMAMAV